MRSTTVTIAQDRATMIAKATVLTFEQDVKIKNPDPAEGDKITVRNTFTVYRDGAWFSELEQGTDGFTKTRPLNAVRTKVCATPTLHITATPTTPKKRGYSYSDQVEYKFNFDIAATLNGKPVTLGATDLGRLASFAEAVVDRYEDKVDAY